MNEVLRAIADTLDSVLQSYSDTADIETIEAGNWNEKLWSSLEDVGVLLASIPEQAGGLGLTLPEISFICRSVARHPVHTPLAEALLANQIWAEAKNEPFARIPTIHIASTIRCDWLADGGCSLSGHVHNVPWGRHADALLLVIANGRQSRLFRLSKEFFRPLHGSSLAGEPRDSLHLENIKVEEQDIAIGNASIEDIENRMALLRAAQIVGAMEAIIPLTITYANERVQFGRPIARFQVIQHQIALMTELIAAATVAVEKASIREGGSLSSPLIWTAKALASEYAGQVAAIAHQIFGAFGFTRECRLQYFTRRLWAWRDECGNENHWYEKLGELALGLGSKQFWPWLTAISEKQNSARTSGGN